MLSCKGVKAWAWTFCLQLFRETKENEIQALLRTRRDLEGKLSKISTGTLEDTDTFSRFGLEATLGN